MASKITAQHIFCTICRHLSQRKDLWHIVNGPKREVWFTAETISAFSFCSPANLSVGFRVYGEEKYSIIRETLKEFNYQVNDTETEEWTKIPDVTIMENLGNQEPVILTIMEAKLISPHSTKPPEEMGMTDDLDNQLKTLTTTTKGDGLLDQLDRAKRLFPQAQIFGLIFAVHRCGQCEEVQPDNFYQRLTEKISKLFGKTNWRLWNNKIQPINGLQNVESLGGMFDGRASLGMGILEWHSLQQQFDDAQDLLELRKAKRSEGKKKSLSSKKPKRCLACRALDN
jgi:hypothetical protein